MGQCLTRPRRPRPNPLLRPIKVTPSPEIKCEIVIQPTSGFVDGKKAPDLVDTLETRKYARPSKLKKLPPLRNTKVLPSNLPPIRNPPRVISYKEAKKKIGKKVRWNVKELTNAEEIVELAHDTPSGSGSSKEIKALVQSINGNVEVVEVQPNEVEDDDAQWTKIIEENRKLREDANNQRKREMLKAGTSKKEPNVTSAKSQAARKRDHGAKLAHRAVSSQIFGKDEVGKAVKEKEKETPFVEPFWKLGDVPIKPVTLPSIEDIENEMKTIESEMQALLKPEEKNLRRSIAFTIGKMEPPRCKTPACVPQRLMKPHMTKVDRVKIQEKQRDAERRRNVNMAERVKSARRRPAEQMERYEQLRRQFERDLQKKAELKMKAASERRHEILVHKSYAARKEARTQLLNERERLIAQYEKSRQALKMNKILDSKDRQMTRRVRSLRLQEKKRELARKRIERQQQEYEERCRTFVETETYDGDEDLGEGDWD